MNRSSKDTPLTDIRLICPRSKGSAKMSAMVVASSDSVQEYRGNGFSARIFTAREGTEKSGAAPEKISVPGAVWHIITCKFLTFGDSAKDIRGQLLQEQLNVALVAALFLTISIPAMLWITELEQYGWSEFQRSLFGLSLCMATANFAIAVVFSVFFSLSIQECVDDAELRRFTGLMGRYFQLSSLSFILGVITLGGFSWTLWAYVTFRFDWFLGLSITFIGFNTFLCVFGGLIVMIKKLYLAKEGRAGLVMMSRKQLSEAINVYLRKLSYHDLADIDMFQEFVLSETRTSGFAEQTSARLRTEWKKALKKALGDEFEEDPERRSDEEEE
jgi:hypothetical protein